MCAGAHPSWTRGPTTLDDSTAAPRDAYAGSRQLLRHRRSQLPHRDRHLIDALVGQRHLGDALGQSLEQREALGGDDPFDHRTEHAVVDRLLERIRLARLPEVETYVEVDLERLRARLLFSKHAAVTQRDEPAQFDLIGH